MSTAHEAEVMDDEPQDAYEDGGMTLMALNSSEINQQIATARRFPRSLRTFVKEATEMVQMSEDVATECMYALKRSGKTIEGPSARFAEIVASAWGNCRAGARVIGEDERFVTSQGAFMDLQRNVAITYESKRRITRKDGKKYDDDMVGVTANAACSIALRNAVLKGVPKAFWKPIYDAARKCAVGDAQTLNDRRTVMLQYFAKMGVTAEQVFTVLEVKGAEDIGLDQLALLKGMATAIKDGDTTVDQTFGSQPDMAAKARKSDLNEKLQPKAAVPEASPKLEPSPTKPLAHPTIIAGMKSAISKAKKPADVAKVFDDAKMYDLDENQRNELDAFACEKLDKLNDKPQQQEIV